MDAPVEIIVHAFAISEADLQQWFEYFGHRIKEVHVQFRDQANQWASVAQHPERSCAVIENLSRMGFRGDFTLEFTFGTNRPDESQERLMEAAVSDLKFLLRHVVISMRLQNIMHLLHLALEEPSPNIFTEYFKKELAKFGSLKVLKDTGNLSDD